MYFRVDPWRAREDKIVSAIFTEDMKMAENFQSQVGERNRRLQNQRQQSVKERTASSDDVREWKQNYRPVAENENVVG